MTTTIPKPSSAAIAEFLVQVPLFAGQSPTFLSQIAPDFRARAYRPKEIIFHQGDDSRNLYVVHTGKVRTYHLTEEGEETTVDILGQHQLLGEFALLDGAPRSATAQTMSDSLLLEMNSERCLHYLETTPGLALAMCRQVVAKVRWTTAYAEKVASMEAEQSLAQLLLLFREKFGQTLEPGKGYRIDLGMDQGELATMVGKSRQWINGILRSWEKRGLAKFEDKKITILDLERFR